MSTLAGKITKSTAKRPNAAAVALGLAALALPGSALAQERPQVDLAKVIAAFDVCREAPAGRAQTLDFARSKGFRDLPEEAQRKFPFAAAIPLERDGVWLRATGPSEWGNRGGSCEVQAPVAPQTDYAQVAAALEPKFGIPGQQAKGDQAKFWRIDGRYFNARIISGGLVLFMAFPEPSAEELAAAKQAKAEKDARELAARKAAILPAPPADFGAAAAGCIAAVGPKGLDPARLEALGWQELPLSEKAAGKYFAYQRPGNAVRLYLSTEITKNGQCVAEGNNPATGQFGAIAGAVKKDAATALGSKLKSAGSSSSPTGYSRGEGYLTGDMAVLISSENRPEAMNVRVLVMRLDPGKNPGAFASEAGMGAATLPDAIAGMISKPDSPSNSSTPQP